MKKVIGSILLGALFSGLSACNAGGNSWSYSSKPDVQDVSNKKNLSDGSYNFHLVARGCETIRPSGGVCSVTITYSGSGSMQGKKLKLSPDTLDDYDTSGFGYQCSTLSTPDDSVCSFQIWSKGSTAKKVPLSVIFDGTEASVGPIYIGGGQTN